MPARTKPDEACLRDAMHRACILLALAVRAVDRDGVQRAVGYLPGALEADMQECAEAGLRLVQAAHQGDFQWAVLWRLHAEEAAANENALARPDRLTLLPSAARLKPNARRRPPDA